MKITGDDRELRMRMGCWTVPHDIIDQRPKVALRVLSQFVVIRAEYHLRSREITYEGYSWLFRPIQDGARMPEYLIHYNEHRDEITVSEVTEPVRVVRFDKEVIE